MIIFLVCSVTLKDLEHNYLVLEWCGLLAGAFSTFDIMFDGLREIRASCLCARWLNVQKTEPLEELRLFLKASTENDADKRLNKKANLAAFGGRMQNGGLLCK